MSTPVKTKFQTMYLVSKKPDEIENVDNNIFSRKDSKINGIESNTIDDDDNERAPSPQVFNCPSCSQKFIQQIDLENHIKTSHSDVTEGPSSFNCPYCSQKFIQQIDLENHIKASHSDSTLYNCTRCSYKTQNLEEFNDHILTQHTILPNDDKSEYELINEIEKNNDSNTKYVKHKDKTKDYLSLSSDSHKIKRNKRNQNSKPKPIYYPYPNTRKKNIPNYKNGDIPMIDVSNKRKSNLKQTKKHKTTDDDKEYKPTKITKLPIGEKVNLRRSKRIRLDTEGEENYFGNRRSPN